MWEIYEYAGRSAMFLFQVDHEDDKYFYPIKGSIVMCLCTEDYLYPPNWFSCEHKEFEKTECSYGRGELQKGYHYIKTV